MMPLLYLVQAEQGYVSPDGIKLVAELLGLTTAEVAAVSTFYTMYKRRSCGDYHVGVCTNTLCAILGGDAIFAALKEHLGCAATTARLPTARSPSSTSNATPPATTRRS